MHEARHRGRRSTGLGRPLLILCLGIALVWLVLTTAETGVLEQWLNQGQLSEDAAAALLRWELGEVSGAELSAVNLLRLSSPLLPWSTASLPEPAETTLAAATPETASTPAPKIPFIPVLVPALPVPDDDPAASEAPSETPDTSAWDDRVWATPNPGDPGAHRVQEVTLLPSRDGEYLTDGTVVVNNDTKYSIDVPTLLSAPSVLKKAAENAPQILILHTHGSESYLPDSRDWYVPTDIERTEDTRYNVVRLGDELTRRFEEMGLSVIHDRDIHDYPSYNKSYSKAYACIQKYLKEYPSIQIVIDLHRDSISKADGTVYKTVSETDQGKAAQMMFVLGSDNNGLFHDNWRKNLGFAAALQSKLLETHPTLMRPIHLRKERFNMHATLGSVILEVGTAANTLNEAILAANLFCDVAGPWFASELLGQSGGE